MSSGFALPVECASQSITSSSTCGFILSRLRSHGHDRTKPRLPSRLARFGLWPRRFSPGVRVRRAQRRDDRQRRVGHRRRAPVSSARNGAMDRSRRKLDLDLRPLADRAAMGADRRALPGAGRRRIRAGRAGRRLWQRLSLEVETDQGGQSFRARWLYQMPKNDIGLQVEKADPGRQDRRIRQPDQGRTVARVRPKPGRPDPDRERLGESSGISGGRARDAIAGARRAESPGGASRDHVA